MAATEYFDHREFRRVSCVNGTVTGSRDPRQLIRPGGPVMPEDSFTADITAIRKRAQGHDDLVDLLGA
jgi:hypothetical protein